MGVLYTKEEMQEALAELRIKPVEGNLVNVGEAARILTWRAKSERGIERDYSTHAVRSHIDQGNLSIAKQVNPRFNLFRVEDVFSVPLAPKRGTVRKETTEGAMRPLVRGVEALHKVSCLVPELVS